MAQMINISNTNTDPNFRYKMPKLVSKVEGRGNGIKTSVMNCKEVAQAIHRPPTWVMKWFGHELGAKASFVENENEGVRAIIMGAHQTADLQKMLGQFLTVFVLCPQCGLPEMDVKAGADNKSVCGKCKACGWNNELPDATDHRLSKEVIKGIIKRFFYNSFRVVGEDRWGRIICIRYSRAVAPLAPVVVVSERIVVRREW